MQGNIGDNNTWRVPIVAVDALFYSRAPFRGGETPGFRRKTRRKSAAAEGMR